MKTVVIFHGWPRAIDENHFLYRYFLENNYEVIAPYFFDYASILTPENAVSIVREQLGNETPEVIVGISMGGLLAPALAKEFPAAKLVFIASGPYFKPKSSIIKLGFAFLKSWLGNGCLKIVGRLPRKALFFLFETIYRIVDPRRKLDSDKGDLYKNNLAAVFEAFVKISSAKEIEVVNFITSVDNSQILREIKNPTIIFAGHNDFLMPLEIKDKLRQFLANSHLVITKGGHYQVFSENNLSDLEGFLNHG